VQKVSPYITDVAIEYVIATHSHADHIGGIEDVYAACQVAHTIYGDTGTTAQFKEFMGAASGEPNSIVKDEDDMLSLPNSATLTILDIIDDDSNTNNNSVVTALEADGRRMLVTGDAEDEKSKAVKSALAE
jgi:beta-lactamase superfamily II metal-dependent hydrolase